MNSRRDLRFGWLLLLTTLFLVSFSLMYDFYAQFLPFWFWVSLGAYVILVMVALFATRGQRLVVEGRPVDLGDYSYESLQRSRPDVLVDAGLLDRMADLPEPVAAAEPRDETPMSFVDVGPPAYSLRGFTLYERVAHLKDGDRPVRFFSKAPPRNGTAIPLPEGFTATWDSKKKMPVLQAPKPPVEAAPETVVATAPTTRPCSAMPGPGDFCERPARPGSPYCGIHQGFKSGKIEPDLRIREDRATGKPTKAFRFGLPSFEVRLAKPQAAKKPLRVSPTRLDVEVAKPDAPKPLRLRAVEPDVRIAKPSAGKALRVAEPEFEARVSKPRGEPVPKVEAEEPVVRLDRSTQYRRPIRFDSAEIDVRVDRAEAPTRPFRVDPPRMEVRLAERDAPKRLPKVHMDLRVVSTKPKPAAAFRGVSPKPEDLDVVVPKGAPAMPLPRRGAKGLRCGARLGDGRRCGNEAKPNKSYCGSHAKYRPVTELLVVADTKRRTPWGVGDQDARPGRSRGRR